MDPCGKSRWPSPQLINVETKLQRLTVVKAFYLLLNIFLLFVFKKETFKSLLRKKYWFMLFFSMGISLQDWWDRD